jgi:hypothetical protein
MEMRKFKVPFSFIIAFITGAILGVVAVLVQLGLAWGGLISFLGGIIAISGILYPEGKLLN